MEAGELADTSFKFGEDDPSYDQGSRTLTFKLAKRTFEPDEEITTKKGITYIAVGPNHQYGLTGPLGLVSNFPCNRFFESDQWSPYKRKHSDKEIEL